MLTIEQVRDWTGHDVVDRDGDKIGKVDHIYLDRETGDPTFAAVKTGLFGMRSTLVPIDGVVERDGALTVPFDKATVKDAPNVDADEELTGEEEERLYSHYGMGAPARYDGPDHERLGRRDTTDPMARPAEGLRTDETREPRS
jgi:sporulation protein YlmC with PRC-barrel domain